MLLSFLFPHCSQITVLLSFLFRGSQTRMLAPSEQKQFSVPCIFTNLCVLSEWAMQEVSSLSVWWGGVGISEYETL